MGAEGLDAELRFRIGGRGEVGADGLALWFTEAGLEDRFSPQKGQKEFGASHAFGHVTSWTGLAVFLDTFHNEQVEEAAAAFLPRVYVDTGLLLVRY